MNYDSSPAVALKRAIALIGSQRKLAALIGVAQQSVSGWVRNGSSLPTRFVLQVEQETRIPRYELDPVAYPPEEYGPSPSPHDPAGNPEGSLASPAGPVAGDAPSSPEQAALARSSLSGLNT